MVPVGGCDAKENRQRVDDECPNGGKGRLNEGDAREHEQHNDDEKGNNGHDDAVEDE